MTARCLLLFALCVSACDTTVPAEEPGLPPGVVEGTYTLPDGTEGAFREEGWARGIPSASWSPEYFGLGTVSWERGSHDGVRVGVSFTHWGTTEAQPGVYLSVGRGRSDVLPVLTLSNVPGLRAQGIRDSLAAYVDFPVGNLEYEEGPDGVLRGTFDLAGHPHGTPDTVQVAVEGRFEIPVTPALRR